MFIKSSTIKIKNMSIFLKIWCCIFGFQNILWANVSYHCCVYVCLYIRIWHWCLRFRHGFVHCDPHEANLHVRAHPTKKNKPQLILLDHGLYRQLEPNFRSHYCRLWSGLLESNFEKIETECRELQVKGAISLFAALLTMKPWNDVMSKDLNS